MKKRGKQEQEELRDPQNAALYARVSDKDQNVALQLADLREMAKIQGGMWLVNSWTLGGPALKTHGHSSTR